ncbi:MAG TPA: M20/M25/M40 family metallo-hydrolase [Terriglobales bacterium]|nr:M20/M25/M40 family metallo-hydrolase [Terriglobales bacterium]
MSIKKSPCLRAVTLIALFFIAAVSRAQRPREPEVVYPPQLLSDLAALRDSALTGEYAYRQVAHLTENIGPRMGGSPQAEHAVEYAAEELRKLGLEVRLEEVRLPRWVRGLETAELVQYPGQAPGSTQKIVVTTLSGSSATAASGITAEVVVAGSFDELKALGREKVEGKIVLFNVPFDKRKAAAGYAGEAYGEAVAYRSAGAKAAAELGAAASLIRSVGGADYRLPHTGYSVPAGIPAGAVTAEDADLIAHLASQGSVQLHLTLTPQTFAEVVSHNVVADLKGSEHPEQVVVVSGHLDSWDLGTGAIDDGAGVAVAMEVAHLMQELHLHPRRTIRVIAWMDEENRGRGHDAYAKQHAAEIANHVAAIESDLGAGHPMGFIAKANPNVAPLLRPMLEVLRSMGCNVLRQSEYSPGSDISPLVKAGVPGFAPLQDSRTYFNYHHTAADTLDKIIPRELQENAAAMAVLAYTLANLPQTLPR